MSVQIGIVLNKKMFVRSQEGLRLLFCLKKTVMQQGKINSLRNGFGFITRDGEEKDLFFHVNELIDVAFDDLREGDTLSFEVGEGPKGPNAVKVSLVSDDAAATAPATDDAATDEAA